MDQGSSDLALRHLLVEAMLKMVMTGLPEHLVEVRTILFYQPMF
jgi:hypothetical protein